MLFFIIEHKLCRFLLKNATKTLIILQKTIEKLFKIRKKLLNKKNEEFKENFATKYNEFSEKKENFLKKYETEEFYLKISD